MNEWTCVVVGGGYAGIHAVKAIRKAFKGAAGGRPLRLVLIDKNPYHVRKVLLFKPAAADEDIRIPFARMFPEGVGFVQATVTAVDPAEKKLRFEGTDGRQGSIGYDMLVMAAGSVVRKPGPEQGGIALASLEAALQIRDAWQANLRKAATESDARERRRLMTIAVAGAGISGIETSAELAYCVRRDARKLGLDPGAVRIQLFNAGRRLFPDGPAKVGEKLQRTIEADGVTVFHDAKVLREEAGTLTLPGGKTMRAGLCVWTLGLLPSPMLRRVGLPLTPDGFVAVDGSYRIQEAPGAYSIGDCARVVDPATGRADGKTCKEATFQAQRLAKVMLADLEGRPAPVHKGFIDFFCFGLGPERGMAWTRKWGVDVMFTGRLGWRIRKFTWDSASLLK